MQKVFKRHLCLAVAFLGLATAVVGQTIQANPNPIYTTDPNGLGQTTITFTAPGVESTLVRVNGMTDLCYEGSSGSCVTGVWVTDGMLFELINRLNGAMLTSVTVRVFQTTLSCGPIAPASHFFQPAPSPLQIQVTGVQNATSVDFKVQHESQRFVDAPSYQGTSSGSGTWSYLMNPSGLLPGGYKVTPIMNGPGGSVPCDKSAFVGRGGAEGSPEQQTACGSVAGRWFDVSFPLRTAELMLNQDDAGRITGTARVDGPDCTSGVTFRVTSGQMNTLNGSFNFFLGEGATTCPLFDIRDTFSISERFLEAPFAR